MDSQSTQSKTNLLFKTHFYLKKNIMNFYFYFSCNNATDFWNGFSCGKKLLNILFYRYLNKSLLFFKKQLNCFFLNQLALKVFNVWIVHFFIVTQMSVSKYKPQNFKILQIVKRKRIKFLLRCPTHHYWSVAQKRCSKFSFSFWNNFPIKKQTTFHKSNETNCQCRMHNRINE